MDKNNYRIWFSVLVVTALFITPIPTTGKVINKVTITAGSTYFDYEEPGVMSEEGYLQGISGNYLYGHSNSFGVEGTADVWSGSLDYDGGTFGGQSLTSTTEDSITNFILKGGYLRETPGSIQFFYTGAGYRTWDDLIEPTSISVETTREVDYFYSPVGFAYFPRMEGPWYWSGRLEMQHLWSGDVTFQDRFNMDQDSGWGARVTFTLEKEIRPTGKVGFQIFGQRWDIDESDLSDQTLVVGQSAFSLVEPANKTTMIGGEIIVSF